MNKTYFAVNSVEYISWLVAAIRLSSFFVAFKLIVCAASIAMSSKLSWSRLVCVVFLCFFRIQQTISAEISLILFLNWCAHACMCKQLKFGIELLFSCVFFPLLRFYTKMHTSDTQNQSAQSMKNGNVRKNVQRAVENWICQANGKVSTYFEMKKCDMPKKTTKKFNNSGAIWMATDMKVTNGQIGTSNWTDL